MRIAKMQMVVFSVLSAVVAIAGLAYIFVERPDYLRASAEGVPYFTPPVADPVDGKPLDLGMLVRHFEGKDAR